MLDFTIEDFAARESEIQEYLNLVDFLDGSREIANESGAVLLVDSHLIKTLKGSVYLLLYNLIEATMRESISAIHDKITESNTPFEELGENLQRKILHRAKRESINIDRLIAQTRGNISTSLHQATLDPQDLFSGNIDKRKIEEVAQVYGFSCATDYSETKHGESLLSVKTNRNNLAHGNSTFSEIGGNISTNGLKTLSGEVIAYIKAIIQHISNYVNERQFITS